ncbi:hypothetical protein, partial [Pseudomonas viridiflava]|uniref:hypothetical protein n=1 Tax=Pseudomonas viridiflava TaxID=33069 RepID=UPI001F151CDF
TRLWRLPKSVLEYGWPWQEWRSEGDLHRSTAQLRKGVLIALLIYGKGATENILAHILRSIAKELNHGLD